MYAISIIHQVEQLFVIRLYYIGEVEQLFVILKKIISQVSSHLCMKQLDDLDQRTMYHLMNSASNIHFDL